MLDAIESNISDEHVNNMFAMLKKSPQEEITFSEAVEILENATAESLNKQLHPIGIETERLMEIKMCPICEKRLQNRGDYDVVTHLALCSHGNLDKLDRIGIIFLISNGWIFDPRKCFFKMGH
jgi:riboflavin synthase